VPRINYASIADDLSRARLGTYLRNTDKDTLTRYSNSVKLANSLTPSLQVLEILLRNNISAALTATYGNNWFTNPVLEAKLSYESKKALRKAIQRINSQNQKFNTRNPGLAQRTLTPDSIVAAMTFGFWVQFTTSHYDQDIFVPNAYTIMPNVPAASAADRVHSFLNQELKMANGLRNRIAHMEPIVTSPSLPTDYSRILKLIDYMSLDSKRWLRSSKLDRFPEALTKYYP